MVNYKYRWLAAHLHIFDYYNQSFFENLNTSTGLHIKNKKRTDTFIFKPIQPTSMGFLFMKVCYNRGKHELNPN